MRDTDNIAAHWPLPSWFDPYRLAPEGEWSEAPLMDMAIAGIARVTTDGSYTVTITATDNCGATSSAQFALTVVAPRHRAVQN